MVKVGKSIAPRRKSEAWAELQSMTHAGAESDEDHTGSTVASDSNVGFIPASQESHGSYSAQQTIFSSQGTYSSHGTFSSQESRTGTGDGDLGLEDALSRLRAARQSVGGGAADMSIDEDEGNTSSSSDDYQGGYDDERTMDVTAITGGLRFNVDDEDDEENDGVPEAQKVDNVEPPMTRQAPAPAFEFTTEPEIRQTIAPASIAAAPKLPTFSIDPPAEEAAPTPTPIATIPPTAPAPFTFAVPSPKSTTNPQAPLFDLGSSATNPSPPSAGLSPNVPQPAIPRSPLTFEVSQSPVRPPVISWSPRNSPAPFQFTLPDNGTPRRASTSAPGGLAVDKTPVRSVTPVPRGTPKTVETPTRALSAPPTPKRPRDGDDNALEEPAKKKAALESFEPIQPPGTEKGKEAAPAKPPRRRSFAPRASMAGRVGRGVAQDPALPTILASSPGRAPSPVRPASPMVERAQSPLPNRVASPRPTTPSRTDGVECERELRRQASASPSLTRGSPRPATASLEEIRVSSPLRSRVSEAGLERG
ncbi:hypothetical protein FRC12_023328 [Ceratobasidium sp. 428]|nr:hypothetical protein FRC12_023328 [Ceratobasidium sp. 428]